MNQIYICSSATNITFPSSVDIVTKYYSANATVHTSSTIEPNIISEFQSVLFAFENYDQFLNMKQDIIEPFEEMFENMETKLLYCTTKNAQEIKKFNSIREWFIDHAFEFIHEKIEDEDDNENNRELFGWDRVMEAWQSTIWPHTNKENQEEEEKENDEAQMEQFDHLLQQMLHFKSASKSLSFEDRREQATQLAFKMMNLLGEEEEEAVDDD